MDQAFFQPDACTGNSGSGFPEFHSRSLRMSWCYWSNFPKHLRKQDLCGTAIFYPRQKWGWVSRTPVNSHGAANKPAGKAVDGERSSAKIWSLDVAKTTVERIRLGAQVARMLRLWPCVPWKWEGGGPVV